jgi:DNA polymerase III alpha subunit
MFCHLHVHSFYSFLDSTLRIKDIVALAREAGMPAVALTDTNGMYGAVEFYKACREAGIKPLIGAEIDDPKTKERAVVLARNFAGYSAISQMATRRHLGNAERRMQNAELTTEKAEGRSQKDEGNAECGIQNAELTAEKADGTYGTTGTNKTDRTKGESTARLATETSQLSAENAPFTIHCSRFTSSHNSKLSTIHYPLSTDASHSLNGLAPDDVSFDLLEELRGLAPEEVVILTDAPRLLGELAGRAYLYAELILTPQRRRACRDLYALARRHGVPIVAACDAHFAKAADYETYKILRAIHYKTTGDRLKSEVRSMKDEGSAKCKMQNLKLEMKRRENGAKDLELTTQNSQLSTVNSALSTIHYSLFTPHSILPPHHTFASEDEMRALYKGLGEAVDATGRIAEACNLELPLGEWKVPRPPLPKGETSFSLLWKVAFEGVKKRYQPLDRPAMDRLRYELDVIDRLGFCDYFLTVNAIVEEARRRGFPLLGRGSAANSIVSYALGLTGVDPIRYNLYFERFLNPERGVPPDIDLDFSWRDRDAILEWVYETFGRDHVAMICTTSTLQGRQAIREVGKAMGLAESEVNRFTRPMPGYFLRHDSLEDLPDAYPECRELPIKEEPWRTVLSHAQKILDFPRHLSIHCAGILICPEPIANYTPLQRAAKGLVVTQMDMRPIEDLGLIKIDLLANRSLGVFAECMKTLA